ncbi:hypothetical protein ITX31_09920 [Arthrobacter gandavensis]|uniref:YrzE family protein n=1 Tax=Arthrobacter gandavensis TaxID=169960 RepID=UPI00188DD68C|nr:YrzE family protein [Arthrobacter gandavensis]MBF4994428.1 hypothetical protein [Arthrobacter gandavensis]
MSTEPGSTAAGEPRRRQAEDVSARGNADAAAQANPTPQEPDVTRRLETPPQAGTPRRAEPATHDESTGHTATAAYADPAAEPRRHAAGTRANDTEVLNTSVTGTRDPNDAAYEDAPAGTTRRTARREDARLPGAVPAGHPDSVRNAGEPVMPNREALLAAERERFGGIKFGAAFFGWLTATGMVVLLSALAAAIGAAVGVSTDTDLGAALDQAAANQSSGLIGAIVTLAVLLLAYYAGGYVAGRMARFNGAKQGVAVWLWALVAAAVVIILGLIFNDDIRSLTQLNSVAPLPQDLGDVSAGSWLALLATVVISLIGAILGGLAGMRFHRRVDRATFTPVPA